MFDRPLLNIVLLITDADVSQWSFNDVATWLTCGHDMSHVSDLFRKANVTGDVLVQGVSDDDLIRIGVSEAFQRRAVLGAIDQLMIKRGL